MRNPPTAPRSARSGHKPNAAAIVAAEARAAGLEVTPDRQGRFRIVGDAAELGKIHWRATPLAAQKIEILVGSVIRGREKQPARISSDENADGQKTRGRASATKPPNAFTPGPKARALLRGREIAEADLRAADGAFSLHEVMALLRVSRQAIDKKVKQDALLAVPGPGNERRYPACQFDSGGVVPGLRTVLHALPSRNPWFRLNFLVNPEPSLAGRRPCDLLRDGDPTSVVAAATQVTEMGV
jgi:hypothetical protein